MVCALAALGLGGCGTLGSPSREAAAPLRVGVSPDYPPMVFMQSGKVAGAEVDLAVLLGRALSRPVQFLQVEWEQQIPWLLSRQTDIIMSGMSITPSRRVRVAFSEPYMTNVLVAVMRRTDDAAFGSVEDVLRTDAAVGVLRGTTGDLFVQENMPEARRTALRHRDDVIYELNRRRIALYVDDAAASAWIVSRNETVLKALPLPLYAEPMAWATRPDDRALLEAVNQALAGWQQDGTLDRVRKRWLGSLADLW
jgi:ABC-type amino acid transport substrate-binding protein